MRERVIIYKQDRLICQASRRPVYMCLPAQDSKCLAFNADGLESHFGTPGPSSSDSSCSTYYNCLTNHLIAVDELMSHYNSLTKYLIAIAWPWHWSTKKPVYPRNNLPLKLHTFPLWSDIKSIPVCCWQADKPNRQAEEHEQHF